LGREQSAERRDGTIDEIDDAPRDPVAPIQHRERTIDDRPDANRGLQAMIRQLDDAPCDPGEPNRDRDMTIDDRQHANRGLDSMILQLDDAPCDPVDANDEFEPTVGDLNGTQLDWIEAIKRRNGTIGDRSVGLDVPDYRRVYRSALT